MIKFKKILNFKKEKKFDKIKEKVIKYMKKNNFKGIILKKEIQSFGSAGCQDIIQGEIHKGYKVYF